MNPTTPVLALLMLGVSGVYGQAFSPSDSSSSRFPNASRRFENASLLMYPSRKIESILIEIPGIWEAKGDLHVRGSRPNQTGFTLNGLSVLDRFTNELGIPFIPEGIEEVNVMTGIGDTLGGMNGGGLVAMRMKEGGDKLRFSGRYVSDDYASPGRPTLKTFSYGWNTLVLSAEGPLPFDSKFYVVGELHRARDSQPMYLEPMDITLVQDEYTGLQPAPPSPFVIKRNHVPSQSLDRSVVQWNLSSTLLGIIVNVMGSTGAQEHPALDWSGIVKNYYRLNRVPTVKSTHTFIGLTLQAEALQDLWIDASFGRYIANAHTEDPDFGQSWLLYSDSAANAAKGYLGFTSHSYNPNYYSAILGFQFKGPSQPNDTYSENERASTTAAVKTTWKVLDRLSVNAAADAEWWNVRAFSVPYASSYLSTLRDPYYSSDEQRGRALDNQTLNIGYDVFGKRTESGFFRSRQPFVGSISVSASYAEESIRIFGEVRNQYIGQDLLRLKGAPSDAIPYEYPRYDRSVWFPAIDGSQIEDSRVVGYFLPRLSVRYAGEGFTFSLGGGSSIDAYRFDKLYQDFDWLNRRLSPEYRVDYNSSATPALTMLARPERSSLLTTSVSWRPDARVSCEVTVYRKRLFDQLQQGRFVDVPGNRMLTGLVNAGESSITGVESTVRLQFGEIVSGSIAHAYTSSVGKAPDPSDWSPVSGISNLAYPDLMIPLDYGQTHRFLVSLDVHPTAESALSGLRARILARTVSGHPYTMFEQPPYLGSVSPWMSGVRALLYPSYSIETEPFYSSTVPMSTSLDVHLDYTWSIEPLEIRFSVDVLNLLDTKRVLDVYPTTGSPTSDGWLQSQLGSLYADYEQFEEFYTALNLQNRWAFMSATGRDIYDAPRQIFLGMSITY